MKPQLIWTEVFKQGLHTDANGNQKNWTLADLKKIQESYDPKIHEAPIVIGHPTTNAPAYGWVKGLKVQGGKLLAQLGELAPEFVQMLRDGRFKKRSISLFPDLSLRHLGFLGAMPPAVKGLLDTSFQGAGAALEIEFNDPSLQQEAFPMFEYLMLADGRVYHVNKQQIISADDSDYLAWLALGNQVVGLEDEANEDESVVTEKETQLQQQLTQLQKENRLNQAKDFSQGLVKQGRLTPAQAGVIPTLLVELEEGFAQQFSQNSTQSPLSRLKKLLSSLPKQGHFKSLGEGFIQTIDSDQRLGEEIAKAAGCTLRS